MSFYFVAQLLQVAMQYPLPVAIAVGVGLLWVNRTSFGLFPDPLRLLAKRRREGVLARLLLQNPSNGNARLELGQLRLERGDAKGAMEVLRPALEAGDDRSEALFAMGAACLQSGFREQGERLLAHVAERGPFRMGEVELALGRARLAHGDFEGARVQLEQLVKARSGTVEGRVLLAKALDGLGRAKDAATVRAAAWHEYETAPRFLQRKERLWAWRLQPVRPLIYAMLVLISVTLLVRAVRQADFTPTADPYDTPAFAASIKAQMWLPDLNDEKLERFLAFAREVRGISAMSPHAMIAEAKRIANKHGFELREAQQLQMVLRSYIMKVDAGQYARAHTECLEWYGQEKAEFIFRNEDRLRRAFAGEPDVTDGG